jgi:hypothetical protein
MLVSWFVYSRIVKVETTCYSETSVDFQQSAECSIPEVSSHKHHCENLKSHAVTTSLDFLHT